MAHRSVVRLLAVAVTALLVGSLGCQQTAKVAESPDTGSEWSEAPDARAGNGDGQPATDVITVYFDYNRSEIRPDARDLLRSNAKAIGMGDGDRITVEGHCDERGSTEYNLALGERRANAVKRYLVDLGVPSSRLRTVSFGEDRPAVQGHDESAWRYNRRADFVN
jgi:peptidoglycan-associated lipoprotein